MEWTVVSVLVVLIGLIGSIWKIAAQITKPINDLTVNVAMLTTAMGNLNDRLKKLDEDNDSEHRDLWEHETSQDEKIGDHDKRITVLESKT